MGELRAACAGSGWALKPRSSCHSVASTSAAAAHAGMILHVQQKARRMDTLGGPCRA